MSRNTDSQSLYEAHKEYTAVYTDILNSYKEQIDSSVKQKQLLKNIFFGVIIGIMIALTLAFLWSIFSALKVFASSQSAVEIAGAITTIISSFSTMIVSIFKLPQIIAEYLFNKEEDNLMSQIIHDIQKYEIETYRIERNGMKDGEENAQTSPDAEILPVPNECFPLDDNTDSA